MKMLLMVSLVLFLIACCLPALATKKSTGELDIMLGLRTLAIGWSGIFAGITGWYANPFWLLGLILTFLRRPTLGMIAGIIAIGIACTTFSILGRELPGDEGGVTHFTVTRLLPGCFVWMASLVSLPVIALVQKIFS